MYATTDQLRVWLRLAAWADGQEEQADLLLDLAGGVIEEETGQSLEESTDTLLLDSDGGSKLVLPRWPVTAVQSVTLVDDDQDLTFGRDADYTWSAAGVLTRVGGCWPCGDQAVSAVVTAGFSVIPKGITRIELRLASAAWNNPANLASESLGDLSRSWSAEDVGMTLSEADRRQLAAYKARTSR